jgi:hypothetical protein
MISISENFRLIGRAEQLPKIGKRTRLSLLGQYRKSLFLPHRALKKERDLMFCSARTEWGHLANPQLTWHSYRKEPVAVHAVTLHSLNSNTSMVVHNLYCDRSSGQQETSGRNLKGFRQINNNHYIQKTHSLIKN